MVEKNDSPNARLYFLGIGGTAMGALACACKVAGFIVSGSDSGVYSPMREFLNDAGVSYHDTYAESNITDFSPDVVVVGNALSRGNVELESALDRKIDLVSMPELVSKLFIRKHCSIVVAGTHGKTSTSSLASWILASSGLPTGFFIGAVTGNFGTGCRQVPPSDTNGYFVTEGDEYDTSFFDKRSKFLSYRPDIAIINNIEFDHADIFSSLDEIKKSFSLFARLVPRNGLIIANGDDANVRNVTKHALSPVETFGMSSASTWRAVDIHYDEKQTHFTVLHNGFIFSRFTTSMLGEHNVMNTLADIAMSVRVGLDAKKIQTALNTFIMPKRRLEEIAVYHGAFVIDDFAHHPTAIKTTIRAASQKYPASRIIACFEPRSNTTSRNIFQHELTAAFSEADIVVLGCINRPERYPEDERLDRDLLSAQLTSMGKLVYLVGQEHSTQPLWGEHVATFIDNVVKPGDVILLLSNGDFGGLRKMLMVDERNSDIQ